MKNGHEICRDHGAKLDYYCSTCKIPICSECVMFGGDVHKDHKYLRMAEVY
jgi:tripartite motif-containing protein 37